MTEKKTNQVQRKLSTREMESIAKMNAKNKPFRNIFRVAETNDTKGEPSIELSYLKDLSSQDAIYEFCSRICEATGARDEVVGGDIITRACSALSSMNQCVEQTVTRLNYIAKFMSCLEPQDEIEGQLVAQIIVLHEQAMNMLNRVTNIEQPDFVNIYLNGASKLLVRHHEALDTLMRYRRRGEQRVHVEHVHVHQGGQAIVGSVTTGGGVNQKSEEGPHAKV